MRIELAKLLWLRMIFAFDEPPNHLDIESIIWLESFTKLSPSVVIVSHDKMFLQRNK